MERKRLIAPEGKIYTDGVATYGTDITLPVGANGDNFYLITREEYENMFPRQMTEEDDQCTM